MQAERQREGKFGTETETYKQKQLQRAMQAERKRERGVRGVEREGSQLVSNWILTSCQHQDKRIDTARGRGEKRRKRDGMQGQRQTDRQKQIQTTMQRQRWGRRGGGGEKGRGERQRKRDGVQGQRQTDRNKHRQRCKLQVLVYDILPSLEEGAEKRCSECDSDADRETELGKKGRGWRDREGGRWRKRGGVQRQTERSRDEKLAQASLRTGVLMTRGSGSRMTGVRKMRATYHSDSNCCNGVRLFVCPPSSTIAPSASSPLSAPGPGPLPLLAFPEEILDWEADFCRLMPSSQAAWSRICFSGKRFWNSLSAVRG